MNRWGKPTKNKRRRDPRYFLNESEERSVLSESDRLAGITTQHQIEKLDPNFEFQMQPSHPQDKLKALQDMENPDTATVFDKSGQVIGTGLDLRSDPYWLRSVVTHSPGLVDYTMKHGR